jgi:iron complex outermembrane receptor protein
MWSTVHGTRWLTCAALVLAAGCFRGTGRHQATPQADSTSLGYGSQVTTHVASSVQTFVPDSGAHSGTIADLLEGRVAGLQVIRMANGYMSLRIRGTTSINGNNEPLLVIGGVIIPSDGVGSALEAVAANEVEEISVLKDAGSTAIYGSRGANGVILIRTKRAH